MGEGGGGDGRKKMLWCLCLINSSQSGMCVYEVLTGVFEGEWQELGVMEGSGGRGDSRNGHGSGGGLFFRKGFSCVCC